MMDKYGVDESVDLETMEKHAAQGCPVCGKQLIKHGSVFLCPQHGSEPFEEKHGSQKSNKKGR